VQVDGERVDQRMFGRDDVAVLLKRTANGVAISRLDADDDRLRRNARFHTVADRAIGFVVVPGARGAGRSGGGVRDEEEAGKTKRKSTAAKEHEARILSNIAASRAVASRHVSNKRHFHDLQERSGLQRHLHDSNVMVRSDTPFTTFHP
jgi:hypothetical protein